METWKSPDVLGLHPRDVYLFASDVGVGQRAMLAPRSSAILLRTDVCVCFSSGGSVGQYACLC